MQCRKNKHLFELLSKKSESFRTALLGNFSQGHKADRLFSVLKNRNDHKTNDEITCNSELQILDDCHNKSVIIQLQYPKNVPLALLMWRYS